VKEPILEKPVQLSMLDHLRAATAHIHTRLHQHPLIVELLERPSIDSYQRVLLSFLRFYRSFEPRLVHDARMLGFAELYSDPERTEWLIADLEALKFDLRREAWIVGDDTESESCEIGELAGRLYVVRGSALGGRSILNLLSHRLDVSHCSQFFNAGGAALVASHWCAVQEFCNQSCLCDASKSSAAKSAQSVFHSIEQSFTQTLRQSRGGWEAL